MYFCRKGRGRFRAGPADTLKAALAGVEKRRLQEERIRSWAQELQQGTLPAALRAILPQLLYRPDRNRIETKALVLACAASGLSAAQLVERAGAPPSSHDFHLGAVPVDNHAGRGGCRPDDPVRAPPGCPLD